MEHFEFRKKWQPVADDAEKEILAEVSRLPDAEFRSLNLSKLARQLTPIGLQKFREIERSRALQSQKRALQIRHFFLAFATMTLISATFAVYINSSGPTQSRVGKTVVPITDGQPVLAYKTLEDARNDNEVSGHVVILKKGARFYVLRDLGDVLEISDHTSNSRDKIESRWVLSKYLK